MKKHRYNGPEYVPEKDNARLDSQIHTIRRLMIDGTWRTLSEIEDITGYPQASISAQLRHLRKERFGSHNVVRRNKGKGLYEYQLSTQTVEYDETGQGALLQDKPKRKQVKYGWSK